MTTKKHRYQYYIFYRKKVRKKIGIPDPLFPEVDPDSNQNEADPKH